VADRRPNIVLVMADDHAAHAIGAYGSVINETPGIDRLAAEGMRFDACFCTNSICSPSRATILTGTYNHVNGVTTLDTPFDARQPAFPAMLRDAGYQTALIGKWHLGHGGIHDPTGFDSWIVLPGQGNYHDPMFLEPDGRSSPAPSTTHGPTSGSCSTSSPIRSSCAACTTILPMPPSWPTCAPSWSASAARSATSRPRAIHVPTARRGHRDRRRTQCPRGLGGAHRPAQ
jgi:Sulfatase